MRQRSILAIAILTCLVLSSTLVISAVTAQDVRSDRHSIQVLFVLGNAGLSYQNENFSNVVMFLRETNPDLGLGVNLTVKSSLLSEDVLNNTTLLIVGMPVASTIPNTTVLQGFLDKGGSLLLMSNYNGGGPRNSSRILNSILEQTYVRNVSFSEDAISVSNNTQNWQEKVYKNNTLALRVNSSMFHLKTGSGSVTDGVKQVVTVSCSLNVTNGDDPFAVGNATASSDSNSSSWLLLFNNGGNRIVLSGSASMFNNTYLSVEGNQFLFRNLIIWLVEKFQMPSPDVFPFVIVVSSAVLVCGLLTYVLSRKRRI